MSKNVVALRRTASVVAALLLLLAAAGPTLGHAELDTADPADKAVLETPPTVITLTFTENLDPSKSSFRLLGPDGGAIGQGEATGKREMTLDGLDLGPGAYLIKWTSASADDGDIERGELTFTVAEAAPTASPSPSPTVNPTENDFITPSPSASAAAVTPAPSASAVPTPAPSAAPSDAASSTGDVLLPIVVGLLLVGGVAAFVLRRSRGA